MVVVLTPPDCLRYQLLSTRPSGQIEAGDNPRQERSDPRRIAGREDVGVIVSWWSPLGGDRFGTVQVLGSGLTHLTG